MMNRGFLFKRKKHETKYATPILFYTGIFLKGDRMYQRV
jgi:hypothetical protein